METEFWRNVTQLLKQRHSNQIELCEETGIILQTLRGWSSKGVIPRADEAHKIAKALGVSVEFLLTGEQGKTFPEYEQLNDERKKAVQNFIKYQLFEQNGI